MTKVRLRLESATGRLASPVRRVVSPNCDERPPGCRPEVVIIHAISLPPGVYAGRSVERFFTNRLDPDEHPYFREIASLAVSAHLFVRRDGELIQFVPVRMRAWHAGVSRCLGRESVNDFSIGIELEGCDDESFTRAQYDGLAALIAALRVDWPHLRSDRLFGHADIAPGRKTDPGPYFDWKALHERLSTD